MGDQQRAGCEDSNGAHGEGAHVGRSKALARSSQALLRELPADRGARAGGGRAKLETAGWGLRERRSCNWRGYRETSKRPGHEFP